MNNIFHLYTVSTTTALQTKTNEQDIVATTGLYADYMQDHIYYFFL